MKMCVLRRGLALLSTAEAVQALIARGASGEVLQGTWNGAPAAVKRYAPGLHLSETPELAANP